MKPLYINVKVDCVIIPDKIMMLLQTLQEAKIIDGTRRFDIFQTVLIIKISSRLPYGGGFLQLFNFFSGQTGRVLLKIRWSLIKRRQFVNFVYWVFINNK